MGDDDIPPRVTLSDATERYLDAKYGLTAASKPEAVRMAIQGDLYQTYLDVLEATAGTDVEPESVASMISLLEDPDGIESADE